MTPLINLSGTKAKFTRPELLRQLPIPRPLHGLAPRIVLGNDWWREERKQAFEKNSYCCWACGVNEILAKDKKRLEGHESYHIDFKKGRMTYIETVGFCNYCHCFVHIQRLKIQVDRGNEPQDKFSKVVTHGLSILGRARLEPPQVIKRLLDPETPRVLPQDGNVRWKDWRLVVHGKEYEPKFKSHKEWMDRYGPR